MDKSILDHAANSGQSKAVTFSLTFTHDTWLDFWRLQMLGWVMSDCIQASDHMGNAHHIATMWDELSTQFAKSVHENSTNAHDLVTESKRS